MQAEGEAAMIRSAFVLPFQLLVEPQKDPSFEVAGPISQPGGLQTQKTVSDRRGNIQSLMDGMHAENRAESAGQQAAIEGTGFGTCMRQGPDLWGDEDFLPMLDSNERSGMHNSKARTRRGGVKQGRDVRALRQRQLPQQQDVHATLWQVGSLVLHVAGKAFLVMPGHNPFAAGVLEVYFSIHDLCATR